MNHSPELIKKSMMMMTESANRAQGERLLRAWLIIRIRNKIKLR